MTRNWPGRERRGRGEGIQRQHVKRHVSAADETVCQTRANSRQLVRFVDVMKNGRLLCEGIGRA